jgi:hypothetical protein
MIGYLGWKDGALTSHDAVAYIVALHPSWYLEEGLRDLCGENMAKKPIVFIIEKGCVERFLKEDDVQKFLNTEVSIWFLFDFNAGPSHLLDFQRTMAPPLKVFTYSVTGGEVNGLKEGNLSSWSENDHDEAVY